MIGESTVGFKMKIGLHRKRIVKVVSKSSPPPAPPPAGDTLGCNINKSSIINYLFRLVRVGSFGGGKLC